MPTFDTSWALFKDGEQIGKVRSSISAAVEDAFAEDAADCCWAERAASGPIGEFHIRYIKANIVLRAGYEIRSS